MHLIITIDRREHLKAVDAGPMTESRENVRRRQFRDRSAESQQAATPLSRLCIIQGCLNLRVGANLCPAHDAQSARTYAVTYQRQE